ncbi:hypothetical protein [Methylocystis parvus]|uniref:Uncharacterized protein n=1 Tax=Methylocystis parvus TaxID=134 RepID=A0A6B8M8Y4_9HYPH|nr:hypothetical protein [Methylocystis parvus]QGM99076.1 hypothetical protein F7D14_17345 [Methylocystis parvus]WBK00557.1 hypothetical protein MMG94_02195 [Methylocystis parvus OBBP]
MLGIIGGFALLYGALHAYAAGTGGTIPMLLGALLVLCEFGDAPIRSAVAGLHRANVKAAIRAHL